MLPTVSAKDILLSKKKFELILKPFPYFEIPNFLPEDVYQALSSAFPDRARFEAGVKLFEGKRAIGKQLAKEVAQEHPTYRSLIEAFSSEEFIQDAVRTLRPGLFRARKLGAYRPVTLGQAQSHWTIPLHVNVEFSDLPSGAFMTPHTDKATKLFALLFYMPPDDWKPDFGGETIFYKPKEWTKNFNWMNKHLRFSDVEEVYRTSYRRNTLAGFVKTGNSWHGVNRVKTPEDVRRRSLNVNYAVSIERQRSVPYRAWASALRRFEYPMFLNVPDMKKNPEVGIPPE